MHKIATMVVVVFAVCAMSNVMNADERKKKTNMKLGAFSVSLAVKDIHKSKAFYEHLGFAQVHGNIAQNWVILQNDTTTIGLFQGMFEKNIMTFNPGWNHKQETPKSFTDVRAIQAHLEKAGITFAQKADPSSTGTASFVIADPDGNSILFDQHVPKPE